MDGYSVRFYAHFGFSQVSSNKLDFENNWIVKIVFFISLSHTHTHIHTHSLSYFTVDILLCTSSIYHLSAVSILRFIAIQFPLKSNRTISTNQTFLILAMIWIISTLFSSIILFLGNDDLNNVMDPSSHRCGLKHNKFRFYGSIFSFVIPLLIMIVMFSLMVRKLRKQLIRLENASPSSNLNHAESNHRQLSIKKSASEGMKESLALTGI